jgi:hypothetical protein
MMKPMWCLCLVAIVSGCTEYGVSGKWSPAVEGDSAVPAEDAESPPEPPPVPAETDSGEDSQPPPPDTGEPVVEDPPVEEPPRPDAFSLGWHIWDDGVWVGTTSSPDHSVTSHGDTDTYWYEPSGHHGLIGSTAPETDFAGMRGYVLERVPTPTHALGNLHYYADTDVDTLTQATFTYVMCDFWVDADDDPSLYRLQTGPVDDGIQVIVNGSILGYLRLDGGGDSWNLGPHIRTDSRNTLMVTLVDNALNNKFIQDMAFWRGDIMVTGGPVMPPD